MVEVIKHALGMCGEGHISVWHLLAPLSILVYYIKHSIKWCIHKGCEICSIKKFSNNESIDLDSSK